MLKPDNQIDKQRFKKIKTAQTERGRDEEKATEVAAHEVKELRRREGRTKDPIAAKPTLLISDEAMAGLSASEVDDILGLLFGMKERGVAVIMIEHVMRAVMKFSERIAVLVAGRKIADGDPRDVVRRDDVVAAYLGS